MNKTLQHTIEQIKQQESIISEVRKTELNDLAVLIKSHLLQDGNLDVVVVCTHNSRRSQLGEAWFNVLAHYFNISGLRAYSGGMEETTFNIRMVQAMNASGFGLQQVRKGKNPVYLLEESIAPEQRMFSKVYNHHSNPQQGFMAIMVCDHADENCPIVRGMKYRIPLRYTDPKEYDNTTQEAEAYRDKVFEIGREIFFILNQVKYSL